MTYYIYALIDPVDKKTRYIGCSKNPKSRYRQHLKDAEKRSKTAKQLWIIDLKSKKMAPLVEILESIKDEVEARKREEFHVLEHINTIYNIHLPGKGSKGVKFYKKTGKKM